MNNMKKWVRSLVKVVSLKSHQDNENCFSINENFLEDLYVLNCTVKDNLNNLHQLRSNLHKNLDVLIKLIKSMN